jgi:hypothetical protein
MQAITFPIQSQTDPMHSHIGVQQLPIGTRIYL